jgi:hypothetical protein
MRRRPRTDGNQASIVAGLRAAGVSVTVLAEVGSGCPDLLCGYQSRTTLIEVKDPTQPPSGRQLTPDQIRWLREWRGGPAAVVLDLEGALRACGVIRC